MATSGLMLFTASTAEDLGPRCQKWKVPMNSDGPKAWCLPKSCGYIIYIFHWEIQHSTTSSSTNPSNYGASHFHAAVGSNILLSVEWDLLKPWPGDWMRLGFLGTLRLHLESFIRNKDEWSNCHESFIPKKAPGAKSDGPSFPGITEDDPGRPWQTPASPKHTKGAKNSVGIP